MRKLNLPTVTVALLIALSASAPMQAADGNASRQQPAEENAEKKREEGKALTPDERRVKWREEREKFRSWTPEQREAKRKELRERFDKRLAELQKKKAAGALTEVEAKQLERMELMKKRFEQFGRGGAPSPRRPATDKSPAPETPSPGK
jgi:hypothetical protein